MKAIILAGGFGTRLRTVVTNVPKPMAPVNGVPFLDYLFRSLSHYDIEEVILSVCYMKEKIIQRYHDKFLGIPIRYSVEDSPLMTGGAIKKAVSFIDAEDILVMNGDTYLELNLDEMFSYHKLKRADITIATCKLENFDRYGSVELGINGKILGFKEKQFCERGYINAGIYCLKKDVITSVTDEKFSLEDYLAKNITFLDVFSFNNTRNFVDIGVPDDYMKAADIVK